jgi:hypothetical protein
MSNFDEFLALRVVGIADDRLSDIRCSYVHRIVGVNAPMKLITRFRRRVDEIASTNRRSAVGFQCTRSSDNALIYVILSLQNIVKR